MKNFIEKLLEGANITFVLSQDCKELTLLFAKDKAKLDSAQKGLEKFGIVLKKQYLLTYTVSRPVNNVLIDQYLLKQSLN